MDSIITTLLLTLLGEDRAELETALWQEQQRAASNHGLMAHYRSCIIYIEGLEKRLLSPDSLVREDEYDDEEEQPRPMNDYLPERPGQPFRTYYRPRPTIEGTIGITEGIDTGFGPEDADAIVTVAAITREELDAGLQIIYGMQGGPSRSQERRIAGQTGSPVPEFDTGEGHVVATPPGRRSKAGPTIVVDRATNSVSELEEGQENV